VGTALASAAAEWVIVAGHRQNRPWSGSTVGERPRDRPAYAADCFLCPGNERVGAARNETYVAPKRTVPSLADLDAHEISDFGRALRDTVVRFDNLWGQSFPYVLALHQAPTDGGDYGAFHFHAEFHPPLRKPNLLKYLAGPEVGGGCFLSDTSPEEKAAELRAAGGVHYTLRRT